MTLKDNPMVEVVQADRDAARSILWVRTLIDDEEAIAQTFARHRLAAISLILEEAIGVAEERERLLTELNERQPRAEHRQRAAEASLIAYKLRSMIPGEGD
jgi:hypothetical protein